VANIVADAVRNQNAPTDLAIETAAVVAIPLPRTARTIVAEA